MPLDSEYPDRTEPMMHVFRGEDDHVLPHNGDDHAPARDIKSSLRLHLEKRLEKLEETGQQPANWNDRDTAWVLHRLEDWIMQVARQHRRARPPKPLAPPLAGAVPQPDHFDWDYEDERALWVLRHHGGPVNRIDFSRSLYVALYFASEPATNKDGHQRPGAVIIPIQYSIDTIWFQRGGGRHAMARKVSVEWASEDTADALHAQYRAEPVAEVRMRLHALWLLRRGDGPTAVAAVVGVGRNAVQRWLRWYREGGLTAVRSHRRGGPGKPSYLTPEQEQELVAEAATGVFATAAAVRDWLEARFGVVYTVGSLYTLLPRLGIRLKTPRPRHTQADPQAQEAWTKGGSRHG